MNIATKVGSFITVSALVSLVVASPAFAAAPSASKSLMLVKKNSGFVAPAASYSLVCEIHSDVTLRRYTKGENTNEVFESINTVYSKAVPTTRRALQLLKGATHGRIRLTRGSSDRPTSFYTGVIEGEVVSLRIKLLEDMSVEIQKNTSPATKPLVAFGDANCVIP
jgi:hypothetical protein